MTSTTPHCTRRAAAALAGAVVFGSAVNAVMRRITDDGSDEEEMDGTPADCRQAAIDLLDLADDYRFAPLLWKWTHPLWREDRRADIAQAAVFARLAEVPALLELGDGPAEDLARALAAEDE